MICINLNDIYEKIRDFFADKDIIMWLYNKRDIFIIVLSIFGLVSFASTVMNNTKKAQMASTYYRCWFDQLPAEHPLKQDSHGLSQGYELVNSLGIAAGAIIDNQEEIIKYKFSELDITNLGVFEAYLSSEFDKYKPEYLFVDGETKKNIKSIKLKKGDTKSIMMYRNGEELSFDYDSPNNMKLNEKRFNDKRVELHDLINFGFVKAYVENSDVAKISSNEITAISKGKTKLIIMFGTHLFEKDIIVK